MFCEYKGGKYISAYALPKDSESLSKSLWSQRHNYGGNCCFAFTTKNAAFYGVFDDVNPSNDEAEQLYALLREFISINEKITSFAFDMYALNSKTQEKLYFTFQFTKKKGKLYVNLLTYNVRVDQPTGDTKEIKRTVNKANKPTLCEENSALKLNLGRVLDLIE